MIHNLENRTKFNKSELKTLQQHFMDLAAKQGNENTITEAEFREALASIGIVESDRVILHQVFTTMDTQSVKQINFKDFVTAASILVASDNVKDKLNFSFSMYCGEGKKEVSKEDMSNILTHLNSASSWFGTPALTAEEISGLVSEVFEKHDLEKTGQLNYAEYMHAVAENPVIVQFLKGDKGEGERRVTKNIQLPIWWVDFEVHLNGAGVESYESLIQSEELKALVKVTREDSSCKSVIITTLELDEGKKGFSVREEWHGPFNSLTVTESAFVKKLTELGDAAAYTLKVKENIYL
ncbi:hypothetical protein ScalyP_jg5175 [Parmales sp. scaly parma]|nr:hypothetical protein ScalyP_jg5175 [Parmales sp. scaly parma]